MNRTALAVYFLALACSPLLSAEKRALTNADVLKMVKAELPESTIVAAIQNSAAKFDTGPDALIELKASGVSPAVMEAMLTGPKPEPGRAPEPPSEADVAKMVLSMARTQSEGLVDIPTFSKKDGQASERSGVRLYAMEFEMHVAFSADCIWKYIHLEDAVTFRVARRLATGQGWDKFLEVTQNPGVQVARGAVFSVRGNARLELSERGWKLVGLEKQSITESSSSEVSALIGLKNAARVAGSGTMSTAALLQLFAADAIAPSGTEGRFESKDKKVSAAYPSGFAVERGSAPVVGRLVAPKGGASAPYVVLVAAPTPIFNRNQSVEETVQNTIKSVMAEYPGATVTEPVRTTLAGTEAKAFAADIVRKGAVWRQVFAITVVNKHVLSVVLYSPADAFEESWQHFKRVCETYEFNEA